jgi:hypothetical protein
MREFVPIESQLPTTMGRCILDITMALSVITAGVGIGVEAMRPADASGLSRRFSVDLPSTFAEVKPVLGATALVTEVESRLAFDARVDSGAKSCSIHANEVRVIDASERMEDNVGKPVRFRISSADGKHVWLERTIAEVVYVKNSSRAELRYKVPMTLRCEGKEKRVLVSLNDRSQMNHALLIGRNFLADDFLIDVRSTD